MFKLFKRLTVEARQGGNKKGRKIFRPYEKPSCRLYEE